MVVDGRVGAAPGRAGERDGLRALAVAANEQLGAGADEGELGRADAPAVTAREHLAQRAEDGSRVVRGRRMRAHLAGEHDLLEVTRADALDRALDSVLVVRRRCRARHAYALDRIGIEERHRRRGERLDPAEQPLGERLRVVVGVDRRGDRHARLAALAGEAQLGQHERRRRERGPLGARAAVVREREAAEEDRPGAGWRARVKRGLVRHDAPAVLAGRVGHLPEAAGAGGLELDRYPERGQRVAVAVGLLEAEEVIVRAPRG